MDRAEAPGDEGLTDGRPPPRTQTCPPATHLVAAAGLSVPSLNELCHAAVKPPPAVFAVEHVVIPTDELVATFCPDGSCDIPGLGRHEGHAALRGAYGKWAPSRPQRHLVVNTRVHRWDDVEAHATSDFVFILKGEPGWAVEVVGRYHDVLHCEDGRWRFHRRVAEFVQ